MVGSMMTSLKGLCGSVLVLSFLLAGSCSSAPPRDLEAGMPMTAVRAELEAGNRRFLDGSVMDTSWHVERILKTGTFGQSPSVGVLACADSRLPVELIFDMGVGDLFVVRVAGNVDTKEGTGTFEYGAAALGMHTILVLGHTKCGAVDATLEGKALPGSIPTLAEAIAPGVAELAAQAKAGTPRARLLTAAAEANVRYQMKVLLERSELLRTAQADGKLQMMGGIYDVDTGMVRFLD
jgi:carbonic anhydrase